MTSLEALLIGVIAAERDDLPRLVYADALDETGDEGNARRAEFIRSQIQHGMIADFTLTVSNVYNARAGLPKGSFYPTIGEGRIPWPRDLVGKATFFREWEWMKPNAGCFIAYVRGFLAAVRGPFHLVHRGLPAIANNPITSIKIRDRSPYSNGYGEAFFNEARVRPGDHVPLHAELRPSIFNRLKGWTNVEEGRWVAFETTAAANAALHFAMLEDARESLSKVLSATVAG